MLLPCGTSTADTLYLSGTTPVMPVLLVMAQLAGLNHSPVLPPTHVTELWRVTSALVVPVLVTE